MSGARGSEAVWLLAVLLATGALSWWFVLRPVADHDPRALDRLPAALNDWRAIDLEIDESVSEMLAADHNLQRAYLHPQGFHVFVYVGYYDTRRGGTPEHTPDVCYPAQGWRIVEARHQRVGGEAGFATRELIVERNGERRVVHFWYRTATTSGITSVLGLRVAHVWGRLTRNRGDGALVRVSTPIEDGNVEAARARLYGMDVILEEALEGVWPGVEAGAARLSSSH